MSLDVFRWKTQSVAECEYKTTAKKIEFGDGYSQVFESGINPVSQNWTLKFSGYVEVINPIIQFVRCHISRSFVWKSPSGEEQVYRVKHDSIKTTYLTSNVVTLSVVFEQAYHP